MHSQNRYSQTSVLPTLSVSPVWSVSAGTAVRLRRPLHSQVGAGACWRADTTHSPPLAHEHGGAGGM